jgi:hypothetical protein
MLPPVLVKNDKKAKWLIVGVTVIVLIAVGILGRVKLNVDPGFDVHIFAMINAIINSIVTVLLVAALIAVKQQKYLLHKR